MAVHEPRPIRVGIVGAGANTQARHLPGLQAIPGVRVMAVCNRSEASSRRVAQTFGIPRIAADWRSLLDDPGLDAVLIGTWPYLHADVAIAALDAGKHVLTEARMAADAREAESMLQAARRNPQLIAQVVPAPMSLDVDQTVRELLEAGALGQLREAGVTHTAGHYADPDAPVALTGFEQGVRYMRFTQAVWDSWKAGSSKIQRC